MTEGGSVYETWVITLREWSADPTTPLDDLPKLEDDTFTPATFQRLLSHIQKAMVTVMEAWQVALQRAFSTAQSEHDLARDLVQLRSVLVRRVQLSGHPSLPAVLSDALLEGVAKDLAALQEQLEREVMKERAGQKSSREENERLLRLVRENPLTRVLDAVHKPEPEREPEPGVAPRGRFRKVSALTDP